MNRIYIRRFVARHLSSVVECFYEMKFNIANFKNPPIIILTPGKVGSSSVYYTLKKEVENQVFHIHHYSKNGIEQSTLEHLRSDRKSRPLHLIISKLLRKKLHNYKGPLYIITIVREPISRAVSAFFQNTEFYKKEIETTGLEIDRAKAKELLLNNLNNGLISELEDWFNEEIKNNFDIDVFEKPFDAEKNYVINCNGKFHHLTLKMENLDENFPVAIQEFLKFQEPVELQNANIGEQKYYADSYKRIKKEVKLTSGKLEKIISSKYFQHFYKEKEYMVRQKWTKN